MQKNIVAFEKVNNKTQVIDFVEYYSLETIIGTDSALLLREHHYKMKEQKFDALNQQLKAIDQRIVATRGKLDSSENIWMKRAIANRLNELNHKRNQCTETIKFYSDSTIDNSLNNILERQHYYEQVHDEVIGYKQKVKLVIKQGYLPIDTIERTYILNKYQKFIGEYY